MYEIGIFFVILLITAAGILAAKRVKNTSDFLTGGGRVNTWLATGGIVGTLIGSQSTLGTAQLAFTHGISAWWFALGTGLGCLVLGLFYSDALRHSGCTTQFQIISREYGNMCEKSGAILCTTGTFVSVLAQVTACTGFISALYPSVNFFWAGVLTIVLMCMYIILGGTWGAGMGGIVKVLLLYISCFACMIFAIYKSGGVYEIFSGVESLMLNSNIGQVNNILSHNDFISRFVNMTARGIMKDYGSCIALMLGLLSTQTYMQFILSTKTDRSGKISILWGLFLVPPIGVAGIFIGLFMRSHYILQSEVNALISMGLSVPDLPVISSTIQIFPTFIIDYISPLFAGVMLGTLLITVISGSSGLLLGISAIVVEDIFSGLKFLQSHKLFFSRLAIIITLMTAAVTSYIFPPQTINDLGFLSMTLRSSVVFMPLTCALWLKQKISSRYVLASIVLSPCTAIFAKLMNFPGDSLFYGIAISVFCCLCGLNLRKS